MNYKWIIIVLLVIALVISVALSLQTEKKVTTSSEQAYNFYMAGLQDAERLYNENAKENFATAVQLDSAFASAWADYSKYCSILGQKEEAKVAASHAYRLSQNLPERERLSIYLKIAGFCDLKINYEETLDLMLRKYPDEAEPHIHKAGLYWKQAKLQEAIAEYQTVLKINPNYAQAYNSLGYLHAQLGEYDKAVEYLKKYEFIAPGQVNPHDSLGEIYLMLGRYREALDQFRRAIAVKPSLAIEPSTLGSTIYLHSALALLRMGHLQEATENFDQAEELANSSWKKLEIKQAKVEKYRMQKQFDKALTCLKEANEDESSSSKTKVLMAYIYSDLKDGRNTQQLLEENQNEYKKCLQKCLSDSIPMTEENIENHLKECYQCQSHKLTECYIKLFVNRAQGNYDDALEQIGCLLEDEVNSQSRLWMHYMTASLYFDKGDYQSAREALKPALKINPYDSDIVLLSAMIRIQLGEYSQAEEDLQQFILSTVKADADWLPRLEALNLLEQIKGRAMM